MWRSCDLPSAPTEESFGKQMYCLSLPELIRCHRSQEFVEGVFLL